MGLTGGSSSDTLNPYLAGLTAIGTARVQNLYQPLVQLAPNGQVEYVLAEEIDPEGIGLELDYPAEAEHHLPQRQAVRR